MKNRISLLVFGVICIFLVQYRLTHVEPNPKSPLKTTDWDCLGYYMYLPGRFIYNDISKLNWMPGIDAKYEMSGGQFYQASLLLNGNYAGKYLGGIAMMQIPFFLAAHSMAAPLGYPPDGFSPPYQWAVACAAIFYALLGLLMLRKFLLYYFEDKIVAISLLLLCLATNFIQYAASDSGQSHVYIFALYPMILYSTKKWHEQPSAIWAAVIGYIIGLATICRPTEAVMLFIPLMWNTHNPEAARIKWSQVKKYRLHIAFAILAGIIGIAPQLIYWKTVTGSWIYDVGSAWDFLTPHLRVLTGWEKGWFIYTPVTIFFIIGMFFIKGYPFRKSVLWFCLLNIYIVISWRDWKYGGSYSTRALMQSYPVFALPFAAFIQFVSTRKWKWIFYLAGVYLIIVNIFQHEQYFKTILHYNDMNRLYYSRIYLNPHPTALDISMLDNPDMLHNERNYNRQVLQVADTARTIRFEAGSKGSLARIKYTTQAKDTWLKIDGTIKGSEGFWKASLNASLQVKDSIKQYHVRLFSPLYKENTGTPYTFYIHVPAYFNQSDLNVYISSPDKFEGIIEHWEITEFSK